MAAEDLAQSWESDIYPILSRYCFDCHGEGIRKGGLDLEDYPTIPDMQANRAVWKRIRSHLAQDLMPPPDEDQPEQAGRAKVVEWIDAAVFPVDPDNPDPGRVTLRRLNRTEYENTLRDLFGVQVEVKDLLPPDDSGYGFDNIGDVLTLSPAHLERFLEAARLTLDKAVHPDSMPPAETVVGTRGFEGIGKLEGRDYGIYVTGEGSTRIGVPAGGRYRIKVQASVSTCEGVYPEMDLAIDGQKLATWTVNSPVGQPKTFSIETTFDGPGERRLSLAFTNNQKNPDLPDPNDRDRNLFIHDVRLNGPLDGPRPPKPESHRRIYGERPAGASNETWALEVMERFARRAFRRPPQDGEVERYLHFIRLAAEQGQDVEHGIRLALEAMLVSPAFLFREEPQPEPDNPSRIHLIDEHALASRLSYFLWSSMPEPRLMKLADQGKLREQLDQELDRMLESDKERAFVTNFGGQWLQLRDLSGAFPSPFAFRDFNLALRDDMRRETEMLLNHLIQENRPLTELLDADYTFVNERLARHYQIEGVEGGDFRKVSLHGTPRRGILNQGSFLLLTSHPLHTSPVLRGKFVLENLLDTPPPPPPPGVLTELEAQTGHGGRQSMRQQLEKHREHPNCASCHALMDAIGFGLENFDAVGAWRDSDGGHPINAADSLSRGRTFNGPDQLRELLLRDHRDDFLRSVASKMLTYSLGRGTEWFDRPALEAIIRETKAGNSGTRVMIRAVVGSIPFQNRRGDS